MNTSGNDSGKSSNDDIARYSLSSTNKPCNQEDGENPDKRPKREELESIEPGPSGIGSTSSPKNSIHGFTHQDDYSSNESSNDEMSDEGFELVKPSTSGVKAKVYNVESSASKKTLHSLTYQLRLLMLFMQRVPDGQEFYLSTEMHEAGLFDDVVLHYLKDDIWRYRFIQAKHRINDEFRIGKNDLFNKRPKKKSQLFRYREFLLEKLFESYRYIKENPFFKNANFEEFLVCTNAGFAEDAMIYFERIEEDDYDPILFNFEDINEGCINSVKYRLRETNIFELKKVFEIDSKSENFFQDFIKEFRFLPNYDNDKLNESIKISLKKYFKIENVVLADAYLQKFILDWFENTKDKQSKYLYIKDKKKFLKSVNNNIESLMIAGYSASYFEELKNFGVKFKNILSLCEFFNHKKDKIMFIMTATPKLSVIKLSQLFNKLELKQDTFLLINADKLRDNKKISSIFFAERSYKWLVIEYHHNEIKLDRKMLTKISKMDNEKTVVIIGREDHVLNFRKCLSFDIPCFFDKTNLLKDLTIASQEEMLEKQIIFQGE